MKRVFKISFAVVFALIIALLLLPIFFKPELIKALKEQINEQVNAEVNFKDVDLSFLRTFPKLSVELQDLSVNGIDEFKNKNLFSANNISITTDFKSLIKSDEGITLYSINVDEAEIDIIVNKYGKANYDISKPSETKSEEEGFFGSIESYAITNSNISYDDKSSDIFLDLQKINHEGSGQFKDIQFDLSTETDIESVNFNYGNIQYLKNVKVNGEIDFNVDAENQKYTFEENNLKINDLDLAFIGSIKLLEDAFDIDLNVDAPNNKINSILSIVPNLYTENFSNITTIGTSTLRGTIKGIFKSTEDLYPNLDLKLALDNGYIKYPDLKLPIEDLDFQANVFSKNKNWEDLTVNIESTKFKIKDKSVNAQALLKDILGNTYIDARMSGELSLPDLLDALPLTMIDANSGEISTDFDLTAKKNDVINQAYNKIEFSGNAEVKNLDIRYENKIDIRSDKITADFDPKNINIKTKRFEIGKSDFNGSIRIKDALLALDDSLIPNTSIQIESDQLHMTELQNTFMSDTEVDTVSQSSISIPTASIQYKADKVIYENYNIKNLNGTIKTTPDALSIQNSKVELNSSKMNMSGSINNLDQYLNQNGNLIGKLFFDADEIIAEDYMTEETEGTESTSIVKVPKEYTFEIYPTIKTLKYGNYSFQNMTGKIEIKNGIAELENGQSKLFNGKVKFEGKYDTSKDGNPLFDFKYNMDDLEFQQMFEKSKSFKSLAPIAGFIEGIFNSTLIISGPLNNDMFPDLTKLTASGFLETVQGKIKGFKPLENLANTLKIGELKNWDIKDSRNWFDIKDGVVNIKPHDYNIGDMSFTVGGNHSLDQSIDYVIKAKIPRDKLKSANLSSVLEKGMSTLEQAASSHGVNLDLGENIFLDIFLTGDISKPKIKIIPVGSGGKTLKEVVKDKIDNEISILKDTINKEIDKKKEELKDTVTSVIKNEVDTIKSKINDEVKEKTEEVKDQIKEKIKEKVDSTILGTVKDSINSQLGDKVEDVLGTNAKSEIDSLKEKLNNWKNPFKKKKKND